MAAGAFERNAQAGGRGDTQYNSKWRLRAFEQRALLDVQFNERFVITGRQFHISKISAESRFSANFVYGFAVSIFQLCGSIRGKRSGKQPASQAADAEARWFFCCEDKKFNRVLGPKSASLQRADRFEAAKDSHDTVVFAGIGNRIDVRTCADGRSRGISSAPAREDISNGILSYVEASFFAARDHPRAGFQVCRSEKDAGDRRSFSVRKGGESFQFREEPFLINFQLHFFASPSGWRFQFL